MVVGVVQGDTDTLTPPFTCVLPCVPTPVQITFTGFLINGAAGDLTPAAQALYTPFSWDGMTAQTGYPVHPSTNPSLQGNTPVFQEMDVNQGNPSDAAKAILGSVQPSGTHFRVFRSILKPATWHKQTTDAVQAADKRVRFVDPITLGYLARLHLGGNNDDRVTYVSDTFPTRMQAGATGIPVTVHVRNNGWNTLSTSAVAPNTTRVMVQWVMGPASGVAFADVDMAPGATAAFVGTVSAPPTAGTYLLAYQLRRGWDDTQDFDNFGNPARFMEVQVGG